MKADKDVKGMCVLTVDQVEEDKTPNGCECGRGHTQISDLTVEQAEEKKTSDGCNEVVQSAFWVG